MLPPQPQVEGSVDAGGQAAPAAAEKGKAGRIPRARVSRELGLALFALTFTIAACIVFPRSFPMFDNVAAILRNMAVEGMMAAGMMLLLIGGAFDLSVGGIFSLVGVVTGWLLKTGGMPAPAAILAGLCLAAVCGLINGWLVARLKLNALIATLGTMQVFRGLAVLLGGPGISFLPASFSGIAQAEFLGIQAPVWLMVAVFVVFHYLLRKTSFFRQYYYIGGNPKAARLCGMNVARMQLIAFVIMGVLAGLAGMAFAARIGTSVSIAGDGSELRVITAAILGGASLSGGRGTAWGALVGVTFIALINNIMIIAGVSSYWQGIVVGVVLVLSVVLDRLYRRES